MTNRKRFERSYIDIRVQKHGTENINGRGENLDFLKSRPKASRRAERVPAPEPPTKSFAWAEDYEDDPWWAEEL